MQETTTAHAGYTDYNPFDADQAPADHYQSQGNLLDDATQPDYVAGAEVLNEIDDALNQNDSDEEFGDFAWSYNSNEFNRSRVERKWAGYAQKRINYLELSSFKRVILLLLRD